MRRVGDVLEGAIVMAIAMDWDAVSRRGRPRQYLRPQGSVGEGRSLLLAGG